MIKTFTQTDLISSLYESKSKKFDAEIIAESSHCEDLKKDVEEYQLLYNMLNASKLSPSSTAIENILKHS